MAYANSADPDQNAVSDQGLAKESAQVLVLRSHIFQALM